jgi:amidohydrolase
MDSGQGVVEVLNMNSRVRREIQEMAEWLVQVRRDFHRHPELRFQEHRTCKVLGDHLRSWGLEVRTGLAETGVAALWRGQQTAPVLGIRADMDALPIQEVEDRAYASRNPGIMHACGHDAHMTMVLGAARYIAEHGPKLRGGVKFIFQPAEEGGAGAQRMMVEGVLEEPPVDRIVALHVLPLLPSGQFGITRGAAQASADDFVMRMKGRGSHAAYPHHSRDPILAASELVLALQRIVSRSTNPLDALVVSVTKLQAGTASNVIPEEAELWGTVRALKEEVREEAHREMHRIARGIGEAHGVQAEVVINRGCPVLRGGGRAVYSGAGSGGADASLHGRRGLLVLSRAAPRGVSQAGHWGRNPG